MIMPIYIHIWSICKKEKNIYTQCFKELGCQRGTLELLPETLLHWLFLKFLQGILLLPYETRCDCWMGPAWKTKAYCLNEQHLPLIEQTKILIQSSILTPWKEADPYAYENSWGRSTGRKKAETQKCEITAWCGGAVEASNLSEGRCTDNWSAMGITRSSGGKVK